ncbi:hypothetical protein AXF42_Ash000225 [Apostasia shenzhenica]|uniref:Uncharacterized protein n=1 Tax=Apostasia shenzhenica TaxID=1088818 RepID=A0A2I0AFR7_9ASPA|nr:hypothetical protein AXF42_Ash000225 [Apostasia shenzhenica]
MNVIICRSFRNAVTALVIHFFHRFLKKIFILKRPGLWQPAVGIPVSMKDYALSKFPSDPTVSLGS